MGVTDDEFDRPVRFVRGVQFERGRLEISTLKLLSDGSLSPHQMPNSWNAMQHLVMAMADIPACLGKKTLFGKDKGQIAYNKFMAKLQSLIQSMTLDRLIFDTTDDVVVVEMIIYIIDQFSDSFPNWKDAYVFAAQFFAKDMNDAAEVVRRIRN